MNLGLIPSANQDCPSFLLKDLKLSRYINCFEWVANELGKIFPVNEDYKATITWLKGYELTEFLTGNDFLGA
jgi:hypothetical protein